MRRGAGGTWEEDENNDMHGMKEEENCEESEKKDVRNQYKQKEGNHLSSYIEPRYWPS
jgi:hypothetical protein